MNCDETRNFSHMEPNTNEANEFSTLSAAATTEVN